MKNSYQTDILGGKFERTTLHLPNDYEGEVVATLIRRKTKAPSSHAILYIHGFNDYFFQTELAEQFNDKGFNFYALDLRKYGRSWLSHQKLNNVHSIKEYDTEISKSFEMIQAEGNNSIVLLANGIGGLILTNFLAGKKLPSVNALILNNPFFDFGLPGFKKKFWLPLGSTLSQLFPNITVGHGISEFYGKSIHVDYEGEWNYNLSWKPLIPPKVSWCMIHAMYKAQKRVKRGITLSIPTLVMTSRSSTQPQEMNKYVLTSNIILDIKQIQNVASKIKGDVQILPLTHAIHDIFLSSVMVRNNAYEEMFRFIHNQYIK